MSKALPHVRLLDLHADGVAREVLVLSENKATGDIYFILSNDLDEIDKMRLIKILSKPDASRYPLWELLINETLANGQNALELYHQLVKVRLKNGKIFPISANVSSSMTLQQSPMRPTDSQFADGEKRGPGRPPKTS